jgi:hypothetical protein
MEVPADADVRVGDLVGCGISHPCTTFDKWRWMPVVDDAMRHRCDRDVFLAPYAAGSTPHARLQFSA